MRETEFGQMTLEDLWSGKTSPEPCQAERDRTSGLSLKKSAESQTQKYLFLDVTDGKSSDVSWEIRTQFRGGHTTLRTSPYLSEGSGYTLSQILTDAPRRYVLSPTMSRGIMRRAANRDNELPSILKEVLTDQADGHIDTPDYDNIITYGWFPMETRKPGVMLEEMSGTLSNGSCPGRYNGVVIINKGGG